LFERFDVHKKDSCKTLWSFWALCRPNPGHNARVLGRAFTILAIVPKVVRRVNASVLLTDLTVAKALINWKKYLLYLYIFYFLSSLSFHAHMHAQGVPDKGFRLKKWWSLCYLEKSIFSKIGFTCLLDHTNMKHFSI